MEKRLKPYDMEFMRMAMLKHEETFKEQVYELHRLYRIQKILMKNVENSRPSGRRSQELWNSNNRISFKQTNYQHVNMQHRPSMKLDLEQPAAGNYIADSNGNGMLEVIDESEIELTLGPTSYSRRKKKPEMSPPTSDSGPSFSSSSTGSSHMNRQHRARGGGVLRGCELGGLVQVPVDDTPFGFQSVIKNTSIDNEEELRQERLTQPPWLFQVLSL
ncbi:hypothetical protein ACOSP7_023281 [Xanthoceras sorbifolium]